MSRVVEAVPPLLSQVQLRPPDATTTELLLEYEVLETPGRMYFAISEAAAMPESGKVMKMTCGWPAMTSQDSVSFQYRLFRRWK